MEWWMIALIVLIGGLLVVGIIVGLLFLFGVFELENKDSNKTKISNVITQGNDQSVSPITREQVVNFTYGTSVQVSDSNGDRSIDFYPTGDTKKKIPAGALVYNSGTSKNTKSNFLFTASVDAGTSQTNMGIFGNTGLIEGTATGIASIVKISTTLTLSNGDVIGLYDLYLNKNSAWNTGSFYKLEET